MVESYEPFHQSYLTFHCPSASHNTLPIQNDLPILSSRRNAVKEQILKVQSTLQNISHNTTYIQ